MRRIFLHTHTHTHTQQNPLNEQSFRIPKKNNPVYAGLLFLVATILLGSFLAVRLSYAAWSEPSVAPPGNNTNPPLDTSSTSQNKTGALTVGSTTNYTAVGMYAPIYYDANNTSYYLQPSNTGTSAVFAGDVLIGGTSPAAPLAVDYNANNSSQPYLDSSAGLIINNSYSTGNGILKLENGASPYHEYIVYGGGDTTDELTLMPRYYSSGQSSVVNADAYGNLGVVGSNPLISVNSSAAGGTDLELYTTGNDGVLLSNTAGKGLWLGTVSTDPIIFGTDNGIYQSAFSGTGSLGVGTTSPLIQLQVGSNGGIYNDGSTEMFSKNLYYSGAWKYIVNGFASGILADSSGNVHFYTSPSGTAAATAALSEDMTILNSGDIGIGASSPTTAGLVIATNVSGVALDVDNNRIANLANPVNAQDAATKSYVDAASSGGSDAANSMTANSGMYENKIIAMNPPAAYTEICFKNGATYYDIHAAGAATGGGNCSVGDIGYIIEDAVRSATYFTTAKQVCTENNMRLPEPYEWQLACMNASTWGLSSMGTQWEWASNFTLPLYGSNYVGVGAAVFGSSGCGYASWAWLGSSYGGQDSYYYRCAR